MGHYTLSNPNAPAFNTAEDLLHFLASGKHDSFIYLALQRELQPSKEGLYAPNTTYLHFVVKWLSPKESNQDIMKVCRWSNFFPRNRNRHEFTQYCTVNIPLVEWQRAHAIIKEAFQAHVSQPPPPRIAIPA